MANEQAFTGTPDTSSGYPIDVASGNAGAGVVKRQRIAIGDPQFVNPDVRPTAAGALPVDGSGVTQPVSGTVAVNNFPATQPVSGTVATTVADAANVNQGANADAAVTGDTAGTLSAKLRGLSKMLADMWDSVNHRLNVFIANATLAVTQSGAWTVTTTPPANASTNVAQVGGVAVIAGVKGTQQTNAVPTQDMKDAGRTYVCITVNRAAGIAAEALATMTINKNETVTTATTYTVTAGKTLRLQTFKLSVRASAATIVSARAFLRTAASALAITSPLIAILEAGSNAAVVEDINTEDIDFPDGVEIAATHQIGISHVESTATGTVTFTLIGYEY